MTINPGLLSRLVCTSCKSELEIDDLKNQLHCHACRSIYPVEQGVPIMLTKSANPAKIGFNYLEHYRKDAEEFDYFEVRTGATEHSERRLREYIVSLIPHETKSILDVGCGSAWLAKEYVYKNIFVCSLDATIINTTKALQTYPSQYHAAVVADAYKLPFTDDSFDCIVAAEIIEHVTDPKTFVDELIRVLAPGGALVVSTPYKEVIRYALCIHCNEKTPVNSHLHSFDENKLLQLYDPMSMSMFSWKAFNNTLLLFTRTYIILRYLPFKLWRLIDSAINLLFNKRVNIITKAIKR